MSENGGKKKNDVPLIHIEVPTSAAEHHAHRLQPATHVFDRCGRPTEQSVHCRVVDKITARRQVVKNVKYSRSLEKKYIYTVRYLL